MKVNEFYRHKWNKYVSKIVKVGSKYVELITLNCDVPEKILKEHFDNNYVPCTTIYDFRTTVETAFEGAEVLFMGECIRVNIDGECIEFSIDHNNMLKVYVSDTIRDALSLTYNVTRFLKLF